MCESEPAREIDAGRESLTNRKEVPLGVGSLVTGSGPVLEWVVSSRDNEAHLLTNSSYIPGR